MKYLILILLFAGIDTCSGNKKVVIKPFTVMNRLDTSEFQGKTVVNRIDYYLVEHYRDNERYNHYIDSFANKIKPANYSSYSNCKIVFYKESQETNLKGVPYDSSIIDRYTSQDDLLCD
jgi:hypothetical protein